ncbi:MAG: hypothetical protein ACFFCI_04490 [Promethearchaeota archaeon]
MKYKRIVLFCSLFLLLIPLSNVKAFTYVDYINDGNYAFFLFDLENSEHTEISVTRTGTGNFTLFLFNIRPTISYVNDDKSLDDRIFNHSLMHSLADNPYINFTATETKIYYIEIILVNGGPDTYFLACTQDLTRYYLPTIPGFKLEIILVSVVLTLSIIYVFMKRKLINVR